jgi:uncharacterized repeat protein (TIGR03803 family)
MSVKPDLRNCVAISAIAVATFAMIVSAQAGTKEKILHKFLGGSDGAGPAAGLMADGAGNLYGTTVAGGTGAGCYEGLEYGCGTVFEISNGGTESVLYSFAGGCDGALPEGTLISDSRNYLYGTTVEGGVCNNDVGYGTVFKLAPGGAETMLYAFQLSTDGGVPVGNLVSDNNGNLFGMAAYGGEAGGCGGNGCGVVFEVPAAGGETVLHTFEGGTDGSRPAAGPIMDKSGNLWGTTSSGGGSANCNGGCGTVFEVAPNGTETIPYAFQGGTDGCLPTAGLISDSAGNFYGTTEGCGADNYGTVFKLTPGGSETILYSFQSGTDGELPLAGLAMDKAGNLYGTTPFGGGTLCWKKFSCGTVFEVTAKGREKVLYAFTKVRGYYPAAGLLLGAHDTLYGTTESGSKNHGVVFELKK